MSEYDSIISGMVNAGPQAAVGSINDNPDDGVKALELSDASGVPSTAVYGDLKGFREQYKSSLAAQIVRNNPDISTYVQSHPLAPVISNDDYGNLDKFSQGAKQTAANIAALKAGPDPNDPGKLLGTPISTGLKAAAVGAGAGFVRGFAENIGEPPTGEYLKKYPIYRDNPLLFAMASGVSIPFQAAGQVAQGLMGGVFEGVTGGASAGAEAAALKFGLSPQSSAQIGREAGALAERHMIEAGQEIPEATRLEQAQRYARPWVEAGQMPPRGVHPAIDEAYAKANQFARDALANDLATAQESLTRDRSSDMFQRFAEQHFGNSEIGIMGDKVSELYPEGTMPTPDDGILGWVPGIEDKLALARETGEDVTIPIKDWVTKVDPALAQSLNDDIRMWPQGITTRESMFPYDPKETVDAPLAQIRGQASLEPMFSIGDRKLNLQRVIDPAEKAAMDLSDSAGFDWYALSDEERNRWREVADTTGIRPARDTNFHDFQLVDQNGQTVGSLNLSEQKGGKQLYIEMINGVNGLGASDFGPSLMRDLLRQIKAEFPNAETLTGHRVSGAREAAGTFNDPKIAMPVIRLDSPKGWDVAETANEFRRVLEGGQWYRLSPTAQAYIKPISDQSLNIQRLIRAVQGEMARILPKRATVVPVDRISARFRGTEGVQEPHGLFMPMHDAHSIILYSLDGPDPLGTARHEAIHHLKNSGFFEDHEWETLEKAAHDNDWINRFGIDERYPHGDEPTKLEESIAEAYKEWEAGRGEVGPQLHPIFQKMKEFFDAIRAKLRELLGKEPTWEDLFEKVSSGEVGAREGEVSADGIRGQAPERPSFQDALDRIKANATGLDAKSYKTLQDLIQQRYKEDLEAAEKRAEKQQKREQTREWRENKATMQKEVEDRIRTRPDVAADLFLGSGELFGKKLDKHYRLATGDLTDAQREVLPNHYLAKSGLPVDQVAKLFGFTSGDAMVDALAKYNQAKAGSTPQEMLGKIVRDETNRGMEQKYGDLQANIMEEAKDQALSETQLDLLAEEMYAAASMAKQPVIDKDLAKQWAQEQFAKMKIGSVNADKLMDTMAKHGRDAERLLIGGDPASALVSMQKKYLSALLAQQARVLQKEIAKFEKTADRYRRAKITNVDPEYMNYIHQVLSQVGKSIGRRTIEGILKDIDARQTGDLKDFIEDKANMGREIPVPPNLLDKNWKKDFDSLTTDEFRGVHGALTTLDHNGKQELKITKQGEAFDLAEVKGQLKENLERFPQVPSEPIPTKGWKYYLHSTIGSLVKMESLMNRWDLYDKYGPWQQFALRDLIDGISQRDAWSKHYAGILRELDDGVDLTKLIDNPLGFGDPSVPGSKWQLNRGHLRAIMLNTGTTSNLVKLARGYNLEPADVMAWVKSVAAKEDWDFVQGIWDKVFKDIKAKSDTMYRSLTGGVAAESVPPVKIQTPHGEYAGGYYPIIFHEDIKGKSPKQVASGNLLEQNYFKATTPAGYTVARTGYVAPLSLDINQMPARISQMLHDTALRPAVINTSKIFYDSGIYNAIRTHYGPEYADMLEPYLRSVANSPNFRSDWDGFAARTSEFFRQNIISTLVGFNPGTILKHGPTALVQSINEVGGPRFAQAVRELWATNDETGESNWRFAMNNSLELQRRMRNAKETLSGVTADLSPTGSAFMDARDAMINIASKPIGWVDLWSAVPTWLAEYRRSIEEGRSEGDAVYASDRAVRLAHGSSAITNRPAVMRGGPLAQWLVSVYNFYSHMMNKNLEIIWRARDALDLKAGGDIEAAKEVAKPIIGLVFAYAIAPAAIHGAVAWAAGQQFKSFGDWATQSLVHNAAGNVPIIRDIVNAFMNQKDPSIGLMTTLGAEFTNVVRDLGKAHPLSREHAGRLIQDGAGAVGAMTGFPQQIGRVGRFVHDIATRNQHPRTIADYYRGFTRGTMQ